MSAEVTGGTPPVPASDAVRRVERELTMLARVLEAVQRKRSYPLERAEFIILRTIMEGGAQGVGQIARALLLDDSTMTRQINVLEEKGLAARRPDPNDRRASIIAVTVEGAARTRETEALRLTRIARYLGTWTPEEQEVFGRLLGRFNAALFESLSE